MLTRRLFLFGALATGLSFWHPALGMRIDSGQLLDAALQNYGETGVFAAREWLSLLDALKNEPLEDQLKAVNDFFNDWVEWLDDIDVWGEEDYWATPLETLAAAAGDCEDFSIAKYVSLRVLGVPDEQLRLIYVNARLPEGSQAHMVLGYYQVPTAMPLIMDNIRPDIAPAGTRTDLIPVFSFNSAGLWVSGQRQSAGDPTARLSRWRNVLRRLQNEGIQP